MSQATHLTRRQRLLRLVGGVAMLVGAVVFFQVSAQLDPMNRAALVSIVMIIVGTGWLGQAARGVTESGAVRELAPLPGPPVAVEKMIGGFVLAWLIPGGGHWLIGRRAKAVLYFVTISVTFFAGFLLADGRNFNYERDAVYYLAYMFNGLQTMVCYLTTQGLERNEPIRFLQLGFLYSAVASLLNVVAMMDFLAICSRAGRTAAVPFSEDLSERQPSDAVADEAIAGDAVKGDVS
ncbi:MAG: DUF6677 family protein [Planctomycetota bacterium]